MIVYSNPELRLYFDLTLAKIRQVIDTQLTIFWGAQFQGIESHKQRQPFLSAADAQNFN